MTEPTEISTPSAANTRRIPTPPDRIANRIEYHDRWNALFASYPWTWEDAMAITYATVYIDHLLLHDRIADDLDAGSITATSPMGGTVANPLLNSLKSMSGATIASLRAFEDRVIELAPKFKQRADNAQPWAHVPGAGMGRRVLDDNGPEDATLIDPQSEKANRLLLGGRSGRGNRANSPTRPF